eukprot:GILI01010759.1.p1 GENE.GILI01010759.1~~GILI01010759.1.p1  ORF type:complete len:458 (-),score=116.46 GILI01010759.1:27-1343(-)
MTAAKIPETTPELDVTTPDQEQMITDFVAKYLPKDNLPRPYIGDSDETLRIMAYKYLIARKWVAADAGKMFEDAMAFREKVKFDGYPVFPSPIPVRGYNIDEINKVLGLEAREPDRIDKIYNSVKRVQHIAFHKWDKSGHPILIDCAGKANVKQLVAKYRELTPPGQDIAQVSIDLHTHQNIVGSHLVRFQDKSKGEAYGRRITTATVIMDCKNLGFGHLFGEAVEILKKSWAVDAQYFPEGMHRMFVVNCPGMIMFAYNLFKGMIDKRTQDKVVFCNEKDTPAVLRRAIPEDCIPEFLGGTCKCEGGCVYNTEDTEESTAADEDNSDIKTEEITVAAGSSLKRDFSVESEHQIVWAFESITMSDVEFSVTFTPLATGKSPVIVVPPTKCQNQDDSFTATESGTLTVEWSNKFSWFNSKTLRLRVANLNKQGFDHATK